MKFFFAILFSVFIHSGIFINFETAKKNNQITTVSIKISTQKESSIKPINNLKNSQVREDFKQETTDEMSSPKASKEQSKTYIKSVIALIEQNKFYPTKAKRLKHKGKVIISFQIKKDGTYIDLKIEKASEFESLNNSAIQIIKNIKQFPKPPRSINSSNLSFQVPIEYI